MKKTVLLLTDFSYQAQGREYFREDVELSVLLRNYFNVCIAHIDDSDRVLDRVDAILLRNTGPQNSHREKLAALRCRSDLTLFNDLKGKGDINGKGHLLELFKAGYPVIPTFASKEALKKFGAFERYLLKPLDGADSLGVKVLSPQMLDAEPCHNVVIQPLVDFQHEVSFYFVGNEFQYALYAPNRQKRWELHTHLASAADIGFAEKFINWNTCKLGIQRVDACRLNSGELLLMELEDYNPFLSLGLLESNVKEKFVASLASTLETAWTKGEELL